MELIYDGPANPPVIGAKGNLLTLGDLRELISHIDPKYDDNQLVISKTKYTPYNYDAMFVRNIEVINPYHEDEGNVSYFNLWSVAEG